VKNAFYGAIDGFFATGRTGWRVVWRAVATVRIVCQVCLGVRARTGCCERCPAEATSSRRVSCVAQGRAPNAVPSLECVEPLLSVAEVAHLL